MKYFAATIILLFAVLQLNAQQTQPALRLISLDSLARGEGGLFPSNIKIKSDSFSVIYKSRQYTFTVASTDDSLSDPEAFTAVFDDKNYLAVSRWEIKRMRLDTVEFNVTWSKRRLNSGNRNGSHTTAPVKIARPEVLGAYFEAEENTARKTGGNWFRVVMIGMVACITILAGSQ